MSNVHEIFLPGNPRPVASGGGDGYDGNMEARVAKLEDFVVDARERLAKIEARLDQTATKSDLATTEGNLHKELHNMTWKLIGTAGLLVAAVYFVTSHNTAPTATPAQPPIIINVPQPVQPGKAQP